MKQQIKKLLTQAAQQWINQQNVEFAANRLNVQIERARNAQHGDYASNVALLLAKPLKQKPRDIAAGIIDQLVTTPGLAKIELAGPGFINFTLTADALYQVIPTILKEKQGYGCSILGQGQRIHIEYVSANPTGPLHVGHGRGAAYGACVANLLSAIGYQVHREYYVNDAGRQMRILALSVWLRYVELQGGSITLPEKAYQGDYVIDIAKALNPQPELADYAQWAEKLPASFVDAERELDLKIAALIEVMGEPAFEAMKTFALESILADIKQDLAEFGVCYDHWFYESQLHRQGLIDAGRELLVAQGHTYEKEGALWFRSTTFGDEKDRVLIRDNGQPTYFAADVAYHLYKYNQDYDQIIDVFGADHHGYIARIRAFLQGLGKDPQRLHILLVQFAILYRGTEKVAMTTRGGQFVSLRQLRAEVGNDAARFFYITRKPEQHLDFDLELAKSQSSDNPVYYIQYAHARICSVWRQLTEQNEQWQQTEGLQALSLLVTEHEKSLLQILERYPETIEVAGTKKEPHLLAHYLQTCANLFHTYYNASKFLVDDMALRQARLCLIAAVQQVLANGLALLGVQAPERM